MDQDQSNMSIEDAPSPVKNLAGQIDAMDVEKPRKAVAFKTKSGKEVNFTANPVRRPREEIKERQKNKIIKEYEAAKRREARNAKKSK